MSSVTREGPSPIQCSTPVTKRITLHLNAFRGEPAISAFDWHFTRLPTAHPSILQHTPVRASTGSYTRFPLAMGRSRSFGSTDDNHIRPLRTRFRSACVSKTLRRLPPVTRWVIMQKARHHPEINPGSDCLRAVWFQVLFHSPPGVLFTFPSRYWFAIGGSVYLALEGGPPRFPQGSSCPVVLGYQQKSRWLDRTGLSPPMVRRSRQLPITHLKSLSSVHWRK